MQSVEDDLVRVKRRAQVKYNKLDAVLAGLENEVNAALDELATIDGSKEEHSEKMIAINSSIRRHTEAVVSKKPLSTTKVIHKDYFTYLSHLGKTIDKNLRPDLQILSDFLNMEENGESAEDLEASLALETRKNSRRINATLSQLTLTPSIALKPAVSDENTKNVKEFGEKEPNSSIDPSKMKTMSPSIVRLTELVKGDVEETKLFYDSRASLLQNLDQLSLVQNSANLTQVQEQSAKALGPGPQAKSNDTSKDTEGPKDVGGRAHPERGSSLKKQQSLRAYMLSDYYLKQKKTEEALAVMETYIKEALNPHPSDLEIVQLSKKLHFWTLLRTGSPKTAILFLRSHTNTAGVPSSQDLSLEEVGELLHLATYRGNTQPPKRLGKHETDRLLAKTLGSLDRRIRKLHNRPEVSVFRVAVLAGIVALPSLLQHKHLLEEGENDKELQVGVDLPKEMLFHSVIQCPITREICDTTHNRPLVQSCGHIVGEASVRKMMETNPLCKSTGSFKCPTCPSTQKPDTLQPLVY